MQIVGADRVTIKAGTDLRKPITSNNLHIATFYGLTKAAGVDMSNSNNEVGTYTDEAKGAIQHMIGTDNLAPYESDITADQAYAIGELFMLNGKLHRATTAISALDVFTVGTNCEVVNASDVFARDVRVNGTSVVSDGIAEIPKAIDNSSSLGVVGTEISFGIRVNSSGKLYTYTAGPAELKQGSQAYKPIVPANQHSATFYGLAKAAGDTTQSASDNAVGTYTDNAKTAIQTMLDVPSVSNVTSIVENRVAEVFTDGIEVVVSGTTPTITANANTRYICGECTTLSFTPPENGVTEVVFSSGETPTVLTLPSSVKMPEWFVIESGYTYAISIENTTYGAVMMWQT